MTWSADVQPIDPILFGDNRSARAGIDHLRGDRDPSPLTFFGAVGQAVLDTWEPATAARFLGPIVPDILDTDEQTLALLGVAHRSPTGALYFPRPAHFRCEMRRTGVWPLEVLQPHGDEAIRASNPARLSGDEFLLPAEERKEHTTDLLIDETLLADLLEGRSVPKRKLRERALPRSEIVAGEPRPGLGIDPRTNKAVDGLLFTRPLRRYRPGIGSERHLGWGFEIWLRPAGDVKAASVAVADGYLGGDRRRARIELTPRAENPLDELRGRVLEAAGDSRGFFLYLLTPLPIPPDPLEFERYRPVAAATGRIEYTSGWSTANRSPRPMLRLWPAGSVFFFRWRGDGDHAEVVEKGWLGSLCGRRGPAGFGRTLVGLWGRD